MAYSSSLHNAMIKIEDLTEIFSDVTPLPQEDGSDRVCVIQYPTSFALAYDYMRAIWKSNEMSERTLKLSALCAKLNPANYTVWHFRRECLQSLNLASDKGAVQRDLALAAALGGPNPKNYQIWYHRRALLETFGVSEFCEEELEYVAAVLKEDSKNYHAWSYRQWIVSSVNDESIWNRELHYLSKLIEEDIRNNSAWNGRWFVVHRGKQGLSNALSLNAARRELSYAMDCISLDPYNESPWQYFLSLFKEQLRSGSNDEIRKLLLEYEKKAQNLRKVLEEADRNPDTCVNLTAAHVDMLEMISTKEALEKAIAMAKGLANEHDLIRRKYWQGRAQQLQEEHRKLHLQT